MNRHDYVASRRLVDVWAWKDSIYREVEDLPTADALREIHKKALEVAARNGFVVDSTKETRSDV